MRFNSAESSYAVISAPSNISSNSQNNNNPSFIITVLSYVVELYETAFPRSFKPFELYLVHGGNDFDFAKNVSHIPN